MLWTKTGATKYNAQLKQPDKCRAIQSKGCMLNVWPRNSHATSFGSDNEKWIKPDYGGFS